MSALFKRPFLTQKFGSRGGGIDFLGMRQVNLAILQDELIPGINNATADLGTFCLGAWIPWKFHRLCRNKDDFVHSRYTTFREAVEVAMAYVMRDGSPAEQRFKGPRLRMGIQNQPSLPGPLTFHAAGERTNATSLYAAPLYGPALRYLGLLKATDALAADHTSTRIPLTSDDAPTQKLVQHVEDSLSASPSFGALAQLTVPSMSGPDLDDLGERGLHPSYFRQAPDEVKRAFREKFFSPDVPGARRQLTAALITATVRRQPVFDNDTLRETLRRVWYTNLLDGGDPFILDEPELEEHRVRWAVFHARQIQRTVLEVFLRCFELALVEGCRSIDQIIDHWRSRSPEELRELLTGTVGDLVCAEARSVHPGPDLLDASRAWNATVHGAHQRYDDMPAANDDTELLRVLRMLARWWLRTLAWLRDGVLPAFMEAGQENRLSMGWFHRWVERRLEDPLPALLRDVFSDLVFAQHVKVALMRFDGEVQRLRFTLGDTGIIPTAEVGDKLGGHPVRMADRLGSFLGILCDLDVLRREADGRLIAEA